MKKVKTIILRTAGTNCDMETAYAFRKAGSDVELRHINTMKNSASALSKYDILAIPGGFTYGDDVASGKILANELKSSLKDQISRFVADGKLVIGICNGFQVLVKMGLLPRLNGRRAYNIESTLSLNDSGIFIDKWVYLKKGEMEKGRELCVWARDLPDLIYLPIAHAEGKFIPKDKGVLKLLRDNGQVVFRYADRSGELSGYPHNPNGSIDDIAGICDSSGRILGMMPHPERHISYLQHPNWRRCSCGRKAMGVGIKIFENGVKYAQKHI